MMSPSVRFRRVGANQVVNVLRLTRDFTRSRNLSHIPEVSRSFAICVAVVIRQKFCTQTISTSVEYLWKANLWQTFLLAFGFPALHFVPVAPDAQRAASRCCWPVYRRFFTARDCLRLAFCGQAKSVRRL